MFSTGQIFIADLFNMFQKQYIVHIKGKHPNLNRIELANIEWQKAEVEQSVI